MDFKYKVTVIVPVYNVEEYLRGCLDSLVAQTISHDEMEVLLINDGSTDNSLAICNKYAKKHSFFKVFNKENEGLSATRNYGIKRANGMYMMYLDSDDTLTPETVKEVTDFFGVVHDEVDLVTYLDQPYKNGEKMRIHHRYTYLKDSGVYSLDNYPFITQTRVNICVKNVGEDNILFDTSPEFRLEDQAYCSEVLKAKRKIGFCNKGEYQYNRSNESSIMSTYFQAYYLFEPSIAYFERLFAGFEGVVPPYYQTMFFHDLSWKLKQNILFPYHYEKEQYEAAIDRIKALLDRVDDSIILSCPSTNNFHRHYFLNLKRDCDRTTVIANYDSITVQKNGLQLFKSKKMEIILTKLNVFNNNLFLSAHLKSPVFNYTSAPKIIAEITDLNGRIITKEMDLKISYDSYYHTKEKTNNFYGFAFEYDIRKLAKVEFKVSVDRIYYSCNYFYMHNTPFSKKLKKNKAIFNNCIVKINNGAFCVEQPDDTGLLDERAEANAVYSDMEEIFQIRTAADALRKKRIWLYYDCKGVEKDNGYLQFCHDFEKNDGITRYYVTANGEDTNFSLFSDKQKKFIVDFGSDEHKTLYLAAEKVISAYIEDRNIIPFIKEEIPYYSDVAHPEFIYLQHGILHAHLPWKYSFGSIIADKVVVSSYFELDNFTNTYNFRKEDLIPSGMPRFNYIDTSKKPLNRILLAPSWRNYLTKEDGNRGWIINKKKFKASDYFIKLNSFLNSARLEKFLEEKDLYLDFKIHPIFVPFLPCFENKNSRVSFVGNSVDDSVYSLFITDFSSFVFDFAYLKRPIIYFVPDMPQFKSGMNQYRELDLPFEKAFGNLTTEPEAAVDEVIRIIKNDFVPDKVFKERMDNFFLPMDDCEEKLYKYLMEET